MRTTITAEIQKLELEIADLQKRTAEKQKQLQEFTNDIAYANFCVKHRKWVEELHKFESEYGIKNFYSDYDGDEYILVFRSK